jgi:Domain of unknown function (DUF4277)
MAVAVSRISPVAHLPLILGLLRKLEVAALIDEMIPPHPDNVISCGTGVEALVLAILDGDHALYKVGSRLAERGRLSLRCVSWRHLRSAYQTASRIGSDGW